MEPIYKEQSMERVAGKTTAQLPIESEIPLPAEREAERIIFSEGVINNEISHCASGKVHLEGSISLQLLCEDNQGELFGVRATTQYNHSVNISGAEEGMRAFVSPQLLDTSCAIKDGRVIFSGMVEFATIVEQSSEVRILSDVVGVRNLQKLYTQREFAMSRILGRTMSRMSEEVKLIDVEQLLLANASVNVQSTIVNEDGATVSGLVYFNILYKESGGALTQARHQMPFEELVVIDNINIDVKNLGVAAAVEDLSVNLNEEFGFAIIDCALTMQAKGIFTEEVSALSDAYLPDGGLRCKQETVEKIMPRETVTQQFSFSENLIVPEGAPDIYRCCYASATSSTCNAINENGKLGVEGILLTSLVYQTNDGHCSGFVEDVPFRCILDVPFGVENDVKVCVLDVRANGGGRNVSVSFTIDLRAEVKEIVYISIAVDVEEGEAVKRENGIIICFASAEDTEWTIGKRFGITKEQLREWNPEIREPFAEGSPMVIFSK